MGKNLIEKKIILKDFFYLLKFNFIVFGRNTLPQYLTKKMLKMFLKKCKNKTIHKINIFKFYYFDFVFLKSIRAVKFLIWHFCALTLVKNIFPTLFFLSIPSDGQYSVWISPTVYLDSWVHVLTFSQAVILFVIFPGLLSPNQFFHLMTLSTKEDQRRGSGYSFMCWSRDV